MSKRKPLAPMDRGMSDRDRKLLASIRAAADDKGRHPELHDPKFAAIVEGRITAPRGCGKKGRFHAPAHAEKAARDCAEKYDCYFGFYHCVFCNGYHLTTSTGTPNG